MEDIFREMGQGDLKEFDFSVPEQPDTTKYVAQQIRKSYVQPEAVRSDGQPKDFNPDEGYFLQGDIGNRDKQSFETKNYNVEDAYTKLHNGDYVRTYDDYQVGRDNAEYAAQTQTTGEKWANGLAKFAGKVGTGLVGGTVGILDGVYEAMKEGSFRATYDNQFTNYLDDLNEKMDYKLPNYYSKEEREKSILGSVGTANFWANDVLGGAAFTISAIGSEIAFDWATGGAGLATSAARLGAKAERLIGIESKFSRGLKAMSEAKALASEPVLNTFLNAKLPVAIATKLGKAGELANTARFVYTSAGFEAGVEARTYIREAENNFKTGFVSKNGREPSEDEINAFQSKLTDSANALYGFNVAIVGSSNLMTIGRIFDMKSPLTASSKWLNSSLFGIGVTGEGVAQIASKGQKIAQYAWGIGKSPLIEGVWEEGMQSVGSNTAKNWIEASYDQKHLKNTLSLGEAFTQGFSDTYGSKDDMKGVLIGAIIGLVSGTGIGILKGEGVKGELSHEIHNVNEVEKFYKTNYSPNQLAQSIVLSNRVQSANENSDNAQAKGDFLGGELSRQSAIIAQATYAHNLDYFSETLDRTEAGIRNIADALIMKEYGVKQEDVASIKDNLVEDYRSTAETYKKNRQFSEYYLGNTLTKEEQEKAGGLEISQIKDSLAYELTLGEKVHDFSEDLLTSLKTEVGNSFLGGDIAGSLDIENVLLKAGEETRREASKKEGQVKALETRRLNLERDYKEVEKTLTNSVEPEQRSKILTRLDNLMAKKEQVRLEKEDLVKQYSILLGTAALSNPFGNNVQAPLITEETILGKEEQLKKVKDLVNQYDKVSPQRGLKLKKLIEEYGKSMYAFKRYADISRQLSDPKLQAKGKQNIVSELMSEKGTNQITTEFLQGIADSRKQDAEDAVVNKLSEDQGVQEALGDSIKDTEVKTNEEKITPKSKDIKSFVNNLIKESPYLLQYYGGEVAPTMPIEEEISEFEELATKALSDKRINKRNLSYENPSNEIWFPQEGRNKVKLTAPEIKRLQELNAKLANWRLLEVYGSKDGVSIADMLQQEVSSNQEVEPVEQSPEIGEQELQATIEVNPTEMDNGEAVRPSSVLQTYEDVFMSESPKGISVHHFNMSGLLNRLNIAKVNYAKVITKKGGQETLSDVQEDLDPTNIDTLARSGARFTLVFPDNTTATIDIGKGSQITFRNREDYTKVFSEAGIETKTIQADPNSKSKAYYPVYDLNTGKKLGTTFKDANTYSPGQLYEITSGQPVEFSIDLFNDENQRIIRQYEDGLASNRPAEDLEADLMSNIQISVSGTTGQKFSDLKAAYDTDSNPEFLKIRNSALLAVKKAVEEGLSLTNGRQKLPYQTSIRYLLLGTPNFVYEDGKMKFFEINPKQVKNYGYIQDGKLVLKDNNSGPIRTDFIKGMMKKNKTPFIVLEQGKYLIAIPVSLNRTQLNKGDEFLNSMQTEIESGDGRNLAQMANNLNQLLASNNISPKSFNLYFLDAENQTLFDNEGNISTSFKSALEELNKVQDMVDVNSWMDKAHTKEKLASEITSPIDTDDKIASSPKPVINLTQGGLQELEGNWLDRAIRTGEISDSKATEVVDDFLSNRGISPQVLELVQKNPKIQALLKEALRLEPKLQSKIKAVLNEIEEC